MSRRRKRADSASRRDFIRASAWVASGAVAGGLQNAVAENDQHLDSDATAAFGDNEIRIGLIGCGRRGINAAIQALNTAADPQLKPNGPVRLVALGDMFPNRLQAAYRAIRGSHPARCDLPRSRQFCGPDAYQRVAECDLDLVIIASPPAWRPLHFEAAIRAERHVFLEKPCAVDAPGVRRVMAANDLSKKKGLAVAVGLQRRHEPRYRETIARLQEGAIGRILLTRVYWNATGSRAPDRKASDSEWQHQVRNWQCYTGLSGGLLCEQHIHNLDISNWLMGAAPIECNGMGGRIIGRSNATPQVQEHHFCEFTYADGARMYSQCRRVRGAWNNVSEHAHGTQGRADISGGKIYNSVGDLIWRSQADGDGHQQEQNDLLVAIRRGEVYNEIDYAAQSTLTAVMGRIASQTGQLVTWEQAVESEALFAHPAI